MTRGDCRSGVCPGRAAKAALVCLVLAALRLGGAAAQATHAAERRDRPERTVVSAEDLTLYPPPGGGASFAFLPNGAAQSFDRNLVLSAAPGETRSYLLKTKDESDGEAHIVAYIVDKRRPRAPKAEPPSGLYYASLAPELRGDAGSVIMWAIVGADGSTGDFVAFSRESRPTLSPPAKGSVTQALLAYSVNRAGVRSYPSRFVYRMAEPGLPAALPRIDESSLSVDAALPAPKIERQRGYVELSMPLASGASLLADFSVSSPPASLDDFERIESVDEVAKLRIPCPYAWSGEVKLYFGTLNAGSAFYNPEPLVVSLAYPAEESPAPPVPPTPLLAADPAGSGGFVAFPAYDGSIYVSIAGAEPQLYRAPIPLSGASAELRLSWYGEDSKGRRSAAQSGTFSLPRGLRDVELSGAADGASINGDVVLKPDADSLAALSAKDKASVRYELRIDGSFPPEPGQNSPLLGDSLAIACPPGEERSVVLRYRTISEREESEGRILRFTLDRKPPEAPRAVGAGAAYSDKPLSLELEPGKGGREVLASISIDGELAPFLPVKAPIALPGSDAGPVAYRIRAYDLDAAGNRSPEMEALSFVVDKTSVYVAEDGDDRGDGTPSKPLRSLVAAVAAALSGGKRNVNMRGTLELRAPLRLSRAMNFVGGYDNAWTKDGSIRAVLKVSTPQGQSAFSLKGGEFGLRRIDLRAESAGEGSLLEVEGSALSIVESTLAAGSEGDLILVSATDSKIDVAASQLRAASAMSFTAFSADRCAISLSESSILAAKAVRIFSAFDCEGGSVAISQSLLESRSDLGLSLLSLRSASLLMDRSVISAEGGSGFLRLGLFRSVSGEVKNSKVILDWNGPGTLFEIEEGGPSFRHDTMTVSSAKGPLRFFDMRGKPIQVWNCILDCSGPEGELVRSEAPPPAGTLAADCVWGFDYLFAGALEARDLKSLNVINASSKLFSSKPIVSEPPETSFDAPMKRQSSLRKGSACVGAALSLGSGYEVDFNGRPRPAPGKESPDIGADELSD